ncbi:NUMOD4 domain-containing protein [Bacillus thuringiensis]|uniref:NUMOD4 domain-containing protein n=1 Tax=Bacillus thuringiensis TaxID=1428 RepID=UPI003000C274
MKNKITWVDVVGYEGVYEVSDTGLIRTNAKKITHTKHHGIRHWKQRILKDKTPNGREARVTLWKNGKSKDFLGHRLVAEAFIPKIKAKTSINNLDGNPKNNHVLNLEWCNHKENNNHAFDNDLTTCN